MLSTPSFGGRSQGRGQGRPFWRDDLAWARAPSGMDCRKKEPACGEGNNEGVSVHARGPIRRWERGTFCRGKGAGLAISWRAPNDKNGSGGRLGVHEQDSEFLRPALAALMMGGHRGPVCGFAFDLCQGRPPGLPRLFLAPARRKEGRIPDGRVVRHGARDRASVTTLGTDICRPPGTGRCSCCRAGSPAQPRDHSARMPTGRWWRSGGPGPAINTLTPSPSSRDRTSAASCQSKPSYGAPVPRGRGKGRSSVDGGERQSQANGRAVSKGWSARARGGGKAVRLSKHRGRTVVARQPA